jgi:flagellar motility protein MotE (MotC chaperone)
VKRAILILTGVLCTVVVIAEAAGVGLLWLQDRLNSETVGEIVAILSGRETDDPLDAAGAERVEPSSGQVMQQRIARTFDLGVRETEIGVLKSMVTEKRDALLAEKSLFENQKREFEDRLAAMQERLEGEASEQTRSVLTSLSPADAVAYLMNLDLEENVVLLKGMAPKAIGNILKEFNQPESLPEVRKRGAEIFEALSQGMPDTELVDDARADLSM